MLLLRSFFFSSFHGQKHFFIFLKCCSVHTKKWHSKKVRKSFKNFGKYFILDKNRPNTYSEISNAHMAWINDLWYVLDLCMKVYPNPRTSEEVDGTLPRIVPFEKHSREGSYYTTGLDGGWLVWTMSFYDPKKFISRSF